MFSDGPQPKNSVSLEMPLVPRAESYGLLETLKIIGFPYISTWNYAWPIEGSIVFSRQGTHGRACGQMKIVWPFIEYPFSAHGAIKKMKKI